MAKSTNNSGEGITLVSATSTEGIVDGIAAAIDGIPAGKVGTDATPVGAGSVEPEPVADVDPYADQRPDPNRTVIRILGYAGGIPVYQYAD